MTLGLISEPIWHVLLAYLGKPDETVICLCRTSSTHQIAMVNILAGVVKEQLELTHQLLCFVAASGIPGILRTLLDAGLSVDVGILHPPMLRSNVYGSVDGYIIAGGGTPLMVALQKCNLKCVQILIKYGADVNARMENGFTVIMHTMVGAIASKEKLCLLGVRMLLSVRARLDLCMDDGRNPLMLACEVGHLSLIRLLFKHASCGSVNAQDDIGFNALLTATDSGHANVVRFLVRRGADVDATDNNGMTALQYAIRAGNSEMLKYLLLHESQKNYIWRALHRVRCITEDLVMSTFSPDIYEELFHVLQRPAAMATILVLILALLSANLSFV